jgi:hypothetical protein
MRSGLVRWPGARRGPDCPAARRTDGGFGSLPLSRRAAQWRTSPSRSRTKLQTQPRLAAQPFRRNDRRLPGKPPLRVRPDQRRPVRVVRSRYESRTLAAKSAHRRTWRRSLRRSERVCIQANVMLNLLDSSIGNSVDAPNADSSPHLMCTHRILSLFSHRRCASPGLTKLCSGGGSRDFRRTTRVCKQRSHCSELEIQE